MTLRNAGFVRKFPEDDDLYLTIDDTMVSIRGEDIPRMLAGTEKSLVSNRKRAGSIRVLVRHGRSDLIVVTIAGMEYFVWRDRFESVWSGQLKYARIQERISEAWTGFGQVVTV